MAHNPFNDLYVDSLDEVRRDEWRSWEIAVAICNRDIKSLQEKQHSPGAGESKPCKPSGHKTQPSDKHEH